MVLLAALAGCGGSTTEVVTPAETDTAPTIPIPAPDTVPAVDTALARIVLVGQATLDTSSYTGTETLTFDDRQSGALLCRFVWDALDWTSDPGTTAPDPIDRRCEDPDGTDCDWAFTVRMSGGRSDGGDRCADLGLPDDATDQPGEWVGWGWHRDYTGLGPTAMYYDALFGAGWLATEAGTWEPADSTFSYEVLQGYRAYVP